MQKKAVSPLLTTRWNQNSGWNDSCPVASAGPGGNVYAGCVATATGQVMKYHSFPSQGHGSRTYTHDTYGSLKANFGNSTYNFASMPNNTYSSETAKLLYHIGVSVQMDYGTGASSASIVDIAETIGYFFNYKVDSLKEKSSYLNDAAWTTALKGELDESRPLIYRGYGPAGGHAFVADGYDADDKIHFNFGWSGSGDGYYSVAMINPTVSSTTYTFNNEQGAIFGMTPNITPITGTAITPSCSSNTVNLVNTNGFGIFNVALEDINNASGGTVNDNNNFGGNGYLDFSSSKNTVLETSTTYTISVTLGTINYEYARVYIDYNNNGSFENNGELITSFSGSNAKGLKTASFTTPASPTFETLLRMRVISDYNSTINSCGRTTVTPGQLQYGQAEDYGIYFNTNLGISNNNILSEKVKIYPNPVNDIIRINSENNYSIVLRDINGRELIKRNNFSKDDLINVSSLENGIYLIEIFNNSERYIQKIIKN